MDYTILESNSKDGLITTVRDHISNGWKPVGGISVTQSSQYESDLTGISTRVNAAQTNFQARLRPGNYTNYRVTFYQAMVKE